MDSADILPILFYNVADMRYISVSEVARKWHVSERSVRNYCAHGRVHGAVLKGKVWHIPENAMKPVRKPRNSGPVSLLAILRTEQEKNTSGGIYHSIQIDLTYNSNHIEGSRLSHEQTRFIFDTNTIGAFDTAINVDDVIETVNHFRSIDLVIKEAMRPLSESLIKRLHQTLKSGTSDIRKSWFSVGEYKKLPNEVGGMETADPENVQQEIRGLLTSYAGGRNKNLDDLLDFHVRFERIHPFQDGNGRVGRLILFKECLRYNIVPFIITDDIKYFYYRGLQEWDRERGYLRDTCLAAQDRMKVMLDYFHIQYPPEM